MDFDGARGSCAHITRLLPLQSNDFQQSALAAISREGEKERCSLFSSFSPLPRAPHLGRAESRATRKEGRQKREESSEKTAESEREAPVLSARK